MSVERTHSRDRISVPIYRCLDTQLSVYVLSTSKTKAGGTRCNRCQLNHCYAVGCLCHSTGYLREGAAVALTSIIPDKPLRTFRMYCGSSCFSKNSSNSSLARTSGLLSILLSSTRAAAVAGPCRGKLGGRAYWTPPPLDDFLGGSGAKLCVRVCPSRFRTLAGHTRYTRRWCGEGPEQ